ncbi:MAG TPA: hypothetical protein HPP83_11630, partial [Candidatus Hydrogenedentes bacterium]|nr:hypothetical protein [Candidatus Hydrogenedentota bacterium]
MRKPGTLLSALLICGLTAAQFGGGPVVDVITYAETDAAHAGKSLRIAVAVKLGPGWHVNANKPLDEYLIPTVLEVRTPEGIRIEGIVYPEAKLLRFSFAEEDMAVYEGDFTIGLIVRLSEELSPGDYTLDTVLKYQACDDKQCFPPAREKIAIPIKVVPDNQELSPQHQDLFAAIDFSAIERAA